jgi:DNA-binding NtrC family response regulator
MECRNILYVDDEIENLTSFKYLFKKNFQIILANSALEGLKTLKEEDIQIVISDQRMPDMTGIEFLELVSNDYPQIIRILLTGYNDPSILDQGKVFRCMSKPFEMDEMKIALIEALDFYKNQNKLC